MEARQILMAQCTMETDSQRLFQMNLALKIVKTGLDKFYAAQMDQFDLKSIGISVKAPSFANVLDLIVDGLKKSDQVRWTLCLMEYSYHVDPSFWFDSKPARNLLRKLLPDATTLEHWNWICIYLESTKSNLGRMEFVLLDLVCIVEHNERLQDRILDSLTLNNVPIVTQLLSSKRRLKHMRQNFMLNARSQRSLALFHHNYSVDDKGGMRTAVNLFFRVLVHEGYFRRCQVSGNTKFMLIDRDATSTLSFVLTLCVIFEVAIPTSIEEETVQILLGLQDVRAGELVNKFAISNDFKQMPWDSEDMQTWIHEAQAMPKATLSGLLHWQDIRPLLYPSKSSKL